MKFRKINLQLFAADTGAGGSSQGADTSANTVQNNNDGDNQNSNADGIIKTYTADDITRLKQEWAKEQESNYQSKLKEDISKAIEEEKRLSKLSKDEKDAEEKQKLLSRIESLEKEKELGILKEKALNALSEQKLPNSFLSFVIGNISAIKTAFDSAVQEQVEERLKGKTPNISNIGGKSDDIAEQFANALRGKF